MMFGIVNNNCEAVIKVAVGKIAAVTYVRTKSKPKKRERRRFAPPFSLLRLYVLIHLATAIKIETVIMLIDIFVFYLGLGFLFSHELDAMVQTEWRLLYVLRSMPDETAMPIFVWLHVPLFALIVWLTHHSKQQIQIQSRNVFAMFLIVHAGLHYRLSSHPLYTFDTILSKTLIYGGAVCGAIYLIIGFVVAKWQVTMSPDDA